MKLTRKIQRNGLALALYLPLEVVEELGLEKGNSVKIDVVDNKMTMEKV